MSGLTPWRCQGLPREDVRAYPVNKLQGIPPEQIWGLTRWTDVRAFPVNRWLTPSTAARAYMIWYDNNIIFMASRVVRAWSAYKAYRCAHIKHKQTRTRGYVYVDTRLPSRTPLLPPPPHTHTFTIQIHAQLVTDDGTREERNDKEEEVGF